MAATAATRRHLRWRGARIVAMAAYVQREVGKAWAKELAEALAKDAEQFHARFFRDPIFRAEVVAADRDE